MKLLLSNEKIEINKLTTKGTALHIAALKNRKNFLIYLLGKKPDVRYYFFGKTLNYLLKYKGFRRKYCNRCSVKS